MTAKGSGSRRLFWGAVGLASAALLVGGFAKAREAVYAGRLPALPDLSGQTPAVRTHLTEADQAARARPTDASAVGALGLAYHADMFYGEAERSYAAAQELDRLAWRWLYYDALAKDARGDGEGLAPALRRAVAAAPELSPAWWRLGEAEFKAGQHDPAEEAWRRATSLPEPARPAARADVPVRIPAAPISAYATLGLARLALARNDHDHARQLLEDVTAKSPGFGPAFRLLGTVYTALGRPVDAERAVRLADRLPAYDPYVDPTFDMLVRESRSSTFLLQQASAADLSINAAWREHLIRRALEVDPGNADALFELATLLRVLRRYDEALVLLEQHRRLAPGDFLVLADIGRCLSGLRRFPEAETALRRALAGRDDANARYDLGFVLGQVGRVAEATAEYRRALHLNPNHKDALNNLGVDSARRGLMTDAVRYFERLVALDPDNADAHTNLGTVLLSRGGRDRAAGEFRSAIEIDPEHARAREALRAIARGRRDAGFR